MPLIVGILLKSGEICYSKFEVTRMKSRPKNYEDDTDEEDGVIYITSQRFIFKGSRKTKTLIWPRIVACEGSSNVLTITSASGNLTSYNTGRILASSVAEQIRSIFNGSADEVIPILQEQHAPEPPKCCENCSNWSFSSGECKADRVQHLCSDFCVKWKAPALPGNEPPIANISDFDETNVASLQAYNIASPPKNMSKQRTEKKNYPVFVPQSKTEWALVIFVMLIIFAIVAFNY